MMMKPTLHYINDNSQKNNLVKNLEGIVIGYHSLSGYLNMKIDKLLFENFEKISKNMIIRFYSFANYTITLGYFQKKVDREILEEYKRWFFINRITGGKAVFHYPKKDLTVSLISSIEAIKKIAPIEKNILESIHFFINDNLWKSINKIDGLMDIPIVSYKENNKLKRFDCFQNPQKFEKVIKNMKVIGTAIKISNNKFIVQANIKLQNIFKIVNQELFIKIQENFIRELKLLGIKIIKERIEELEKIVQFN